MARLIAGHFFFLQAQAQARGEAPGIDLVVAADVAPYFGARLSLLLQGVLGAQFTCFPGTKVQILTQKHYAARCAKKKGGRFAC
jgi:hypothetical protein